MNIYSIYKSRCTELLDSMELKNYNALNDYENFKDILSHEAFETIIKEKQNRKNKRYRCDNKIKELLRYQRAIQRDLNIETKVVFGTLTLKDEILNLKEDTYIRKISKYLKSHYEYVILNKDFGDKTEREHYHFIGLTKQAIVDSGHKSKKGYTLYKLKKQDYKLGLEPTIEMINLSDSKKVREYLLKLNNHSNKSTAKKSRIRILKNSILSIFWEPRKV